MPYNFVPYSLKQEYDKYTADDFKVWSILYNRQMKLVPLCASKEYLEGLKRTQFSEYKIPNYEDTSAILRSFTGWSIHVVPGLIANRPFFELMRDKQFCASTWLRRMDQLDYLEEPDMFHDIFGHVPLLTNKHVCHYLEELARIALKYIDTDDEAEAIELISRLYWYTVEFGLVREDGALKIYGAGILSSSGESVYSLESPEPRRLPYNVKEIFNTPYIKEHYQEQYFVVDSYKELFDSISEVEKELALLIEKKALA